MIEFAFFVLVLAFLAVCVVILWRDAGRLRGARRRPSKRAAALAVRVAEAKLVRSRITPELALLVLASEEARRALAVFGRDAQLDVLAEEAAELVAAIIRERRGRPDANVSEEIVDVLVVILGLGFDLDMLREKTARLRAILDETEARKESSR